MSGVTVTVISPCGPQQSTQPSTVIDTYSNGQSYEVAYGFLIVYAQPDVQLAIYAEHSWQKAVTT